MAIDIAGLFGAILILFAWLVETRKVIKSRNLERLDIRFLLIYLVGSITLGYHSVVINDVIFIALSAAISFLTSVEIVFVFVKKNKRR